MRVIVQRVSSASVMVDQAVVGQIERGLLILVAVAPTDSVSRCTVVSPLARWNSSKRR